MNDSSELLFSRHAISLHEEGHDALSSRSVFSAQRFPAFMDELDDDLEELVDVTGFFGFDARPI